MHIFRLHISQEYIAEKDIEGIEQLAYFNRLYYIYVKQNFLKYIKHIYTSSHFINFVYKYLILQLSKFAIDLRTCKTSKTIIFNLIYNMFNIIFKNFLNYILFGNNVM